MVDGINQPSSTPQYQKLKLKGKDGKTIDLNKLNGLHLTKGNEALIKSFDKDNNGVLDEKEASALRSKLLDLAGNGTISKRELNKFYGKDANAMEALSKLVDQQNTPVGGKYTEVSGNTTTELYNSAFGTEHADKKAVTKNSDGSVTTEYQDGTTVLQNKDGSYVVKDKDGNVVEQKTVFQDGSYSIQKDGATVNYDKKGNKTTTVQGDKVYYFPDANTSITKDMNGVTLEKLTTKEGDGYDTRTKYEYKDGQTIAREYHESWDNNQSTLSSITVSSKQNGHNVDIKYASEEDMQNGRPSEQTTDAQNPTLKTVTKYSYDSKGNVKAETTNSAGEVTTKYTNSKGEEIQGNQFDAPETYTVQKGQSLTQIATVALKNQGIDNPTPEQIKAARTAIVEANTDQVHTMNSGKYAGNKYFYANAEINIPKFNKGTETVSDDKKTYDGGSIPEVVVNSKKITQEAKTLRQDLQATLGDNYDVGYSQDGQIEVRTKNGTVLEEATKRANEMLASSTEQVSPNGLSTSDDEDVASMMNDSDTITKDGQIDKDEYTQYINNMLANVGFEITDANREQVQELINNSFTSMDTITADGKITKEELQKNAKEVITKLTNDLDNLDAVMSSGQNSSRDGDAVQNQDDGRYFA